MFMFLGSSKFRLYCFDVALSYYALLTKYYYYDYDPTTIATTTTTNATIASTTYYYRNCAWISRDSEILYHIFVSFWWLWLWL